MKVMWPLRMLKNVKARMLWSFSLWWNTGLTLCMFCVQSYESKSQETQAFMWNSTILVCYEPSLEGENFEGLLQLLTHGECKNKTFGMDDSISKIGICIWNPRLGMRLERSQNTKLIAPSRRQFSTSMGKKIKFSTPLGRPARQLALFAELLWCARPWRFLVLLSALLLFFWWDILHSNSCAYFPVSRIYDRSAMLVYRPGHGGLSL